MFCCMFMKQSERNQNPCGIETIQTQTFVVVYQFSSFDFSDFNGWQALKQVELNYHILHELELYQILNETIFGVNARFLEMA